VHRGGEIRGHIRRSPLSGLVRYYPEFVSILDPVLENVDLEALKAAVTQKVQSTP
jgi:hypothetical protein